MMILADAPHYRIRIDAASGEPIEVQGAIYGGGDAAITLIHGLTPLEVATRGKVVSGMVQSVDASMQVMVDVLAENADSTLRRVMAARARTVLLGDNLVRGTSKFIRGAP
jgi:hypothetical protein